MNKKQNNSNTLHANPFLVPCDCSSYLHVKDRMDSILLRREPCSALSKNTEDNAQTKLRIIPNVTGSNARSRRCADFTSPPLQGGRLLLSSGSELKTNRSICCAFRKRQHLHSDPLHPNPARPQPAIPLPSDPTEHKLPDASPKPCPPVRVSPHPTSPHTRSRCIPTDSDLDHITE